MRLFELLKHTPGTYVCAVFDDETRDNLVALQKDMPNPNPRDELHSTIAYSRVAIPWTAQAVDETATPKDWAIWETKKGRCLVLLLDSPYLERRFQEAMDMGATYDFDEYRPHVTLSYDVGDYEALPPLQDRR